ncbi:MAG: hypothetical protein AAF997_06285 [Myxococcota bacterium]
MPDRDISPVPIFALLAVTPSRPDGPLQLSWTNCPVLNLLERIFDRFANLDLAGFGFFDKIEKLSVRGNSDHDEEQTEEAGNNAQLVVDRRDAKLFELKAPAKYRDHDEEASEDKSQNLKLPHG